MATCPSDFSNWLADRLRELNTDETVFAPYIESILETPESTETEKLDAIEDIVSQITDEQTLIGRLCGEIKDRWVLTRLPTGDRSCSVESVDDKLESLLNSRTFSTKVKKKYTAEEKRMKEAILSQYSRVTDDEDEDEMDAGQPASAGASSKDALEKNTNAQVVLQAEKEKREQARLDSQKKKEKDKEDREKQKQQREEKKEKRKTQKNEKKR